LGHLGPQPTLQRFQWPSSDDSLRRNADCDGAGGPVLQKVQLSRSVRVGVDTEQTPGIQGALDQRVRWVLPLGAGVDFDGHVELCARREYAFRIEIAGRTGATCTLHQAAGAVAQYIGVRV